MKKILLLLLVTTLAKAQCLSATTWDGLSWNNGNPTPSKTAIIDGFYDTGNDGSIDCCDLKINSGASLTVQTSDYCNVYSNITVDPSGILIVKSGGSLIPNNISCIATGIVSVERRTPSMKRYDYTFWSSPVSTSIGNALLPAKWEPNHTYTFSTYKFFDVEERYQGALISNNPDGQDDDGDVWDNTALTDTMIPGKGYISMLSSITATGTYPRTELVTFSGALNVGQINIPLQLSQNTASDIDDFNELGNPYSGAINSSDFIDNNIANISGTLYFWTHTNTLTTSYPGLALLNYSTNDYAKRTKLGGISAVFGGKQPSNVMGAGQGFMVEAETTNDAIFLPSLMSKAYVNSTSVAFFRNVEREERKNNIWLSLTDGGLYSQQLIGYNDETDADYNKGWDSYVGNVRQALKFYSIENGLKLDINGKGEFNKRDVVTLGYFSAISGNMTISADDREGKMRNKTVFLHDKMLGIYQNLTLPYQFNTEIGEFNDRFELTYKNRTITLFPNPSQNYANIRGCIGIPKVYNLSGQEIVVDYEVQEELTILNISNLDNGTYLVKVDGKVLRMVKN